jgi:hypothetical protein
MGLRRFTKYIICTNIVALEKLLQQNVENTLFLIVENFVFSILVVKKPSSSKRDGFFL